MKNLRAKIVLTLALLTAGCYGGYSDSAVNGRVYREISKKCRHSSSLEMCRNFYFSKVVTDKNGKIITDADGRKIRDESGKIIIPETYRSKGWFGRLLLSTNQQLDAMGDY